jgi:hypothetical protein
MMHVLALFSHSQTAHVHTPPLTRTPAVYYESTFVIARFLRSLPATKLQTLVTAKNCRPALSPHTNNNPRKRRFFSNNLIERVDVGNVPSGCGCRLQLQ